MGIFNHSHYEEALVQRVHNMLPEEMWYKRYGQINDFEQMLLENDTHILKFYLHIEAEENLERFKMRIDDHARQWKISDRNYPERPFWDACTSPHVA